MGFECKILNNRPKNPYFMTHKNMDFKQVGLTRDACYGNSTLTIISINLYIMAGLMHSNCIFKEFKCKISIKSIIIEKKNKEMSDT